AGLLALCHDLARGIAKEVIDGEGTAPEPRDMAFDHELLAVLRGALKGALGRDHGRAFLPLAAARVISRDAGLQEQAIGRLVAPAKVAGIVDDTGGIAVAPFAHDFGQAGPPQCGGPARGTRLAGRAGPPRVY